MLPLKLRTHRNLNQRIRSYKSKVIKEIRKQKKKGEPTQPAERPNRPTRATTSYRHGRSPIALKTVQNSYFWYTFAKTPLSWSIQLRIDLRLFLRVHNSKPYLFHWPTRLYIAPIESSFRFPFLKPRKSTSRKSSLLLDPRNFLVCLRLQHESFRSRRYLSISTNLISFHPT